MGFSTIPLRIAVEEFSWEGTLAPTQQEASAHANSWGWSAKQRSTFDRARTSQALSKNSFTDLISSFSHPIHIHIKYSVLLYAQYALSRGGYWRSLRIIVIPMPAIFGQHVRQANGRRL